MSKTFNRMLILAKVEATPGVDAAPTAATDAIVVRNLNLTHDVQQNERPIYYGDLSHGPVRPGRKTVTVTFDAEIKGSGVADTAPQLGKLLRGCGFAETSLGAGLGFDYDPVSTNFTSLTIYVYMDGLLHKIVGARGSFNANCPAGEVALMSFTFSGSYVDPTDTAFPEDAVFEESIPPFVELAELDVLGFTACAAAFTVDVANTINPRLCVNAAEGVNGFNISDRVVTGSFNPEAGALADFDPFAKLKTGETGAFTGTIGTEDNNKCVITGNVQYTNVTPGNRDGTLIWDIPTRFVRGDTGNDEIKFSFPQVAAP